MLRTGVTCGQRRAEAAIHRLNNTPCQLDEITDSTTWCEVSSVYGQISRALDAVIFQIHI